MIIVTGAAGFIGSCLVKHLNEQGHRNLILVDDFKRSDKVRNLLGKGYIAQIPRMELFTWLERFGTSVSMVYHLGARTDTTEKDRSIFETLNLGYSKQLWAWCTKQKVPLIYASSAATYGGGEHGYRDDHQIVSALKPLNPYGDSKNDFDRWALTQKQSPPKWAGMKFFNVYGPNEYHKGRMASVIFHTFNQIKATGAMTLFRSHRPDYRDGEQKRDFIYVKDVVAICTFLGQSNIANGLYNVGTGTARTFYDLAANTFRALDQRVDISFIDTPEDIRDTYQYFTEADMQKLRDAGFQKPLHSLEEGIQDYVANNLQSNDVW